MSLETLVDRNPIVQKIGVIEEPFKPKDVTTKYLIMVLDLVKIHKGQETLDKVVDSITSNHLPSSKDKGKFLDYMNNEHNWVNCFLYILLFEYGKEVLQIEDFYRFVGRTIVNPRFLQVAAGESFGIEFVYRKIAELNPNYNDAIDLEYDKNLSKNGFTVIRRKTKDSYRKKYLDKFGEELSSVVMRNDDLLTQGILESVPKAVNFDNDFAEVVDEPYCESRGDDFCEYHLEWSQKSYSFARGIMKAVEVGIVYRLPAVKKLVDKIFQMEVVIQQKTEEVEERTQELLQAERTTAIKETELKLEQSFSGGLAHEVRNALFDGSVEIDDLSRLETPDISSLDGIIGKLGATIFDLESQGIPHDVIYKTLLPMLQEIDDLSKRLSAALEKYSKATPTIKNSIGRGLVLAEQFLRYSKMQEIERGEDEINVYVVARKIGEKYEKAFGDSGIRYTIDSPQGEELIVKGDYVQLEQILENPILNAKDALEGKAGEIGISFSKKEDSVNIIVRDTGKGIPEENIKKVFDPFFSTKGSKGTGLGLKFVKKLVEAYGGSISIESKVGAGTQVYISLRP